MFSVLSVTGTVVLLQCAECSALSCDAEQLQQDQLQCFSQLDLHLSGNLDANQIQSVLQKNVTALCL
jgi:hypothetical protein